MLGKKVLCNTATDDVVVVDVDVEAGSVENQQTNNYLFSVILKKNKKIELQSDVSTQAQCLTSYYLLY